MKAFGNELIDGFTELQGKRRLVFTELGSVQRLFYSERETYITTKLKHQKVTSSLSQ